MIETATRLSVPELLAQLEAAPVAQLQAELRHYSGMERVLAAPAAAGDAAAVTDLANCREFVLLLNVAIAQAGGIPAPG